MAKRKHKPIHLGEVPKLDFMEPLGVSAYRLAKETGISEQHLGRITRGMRIASADTALRLARFFGTSAQVWMGWQAHYELDKANDESGREIGAGVKPLKPAGKAA